MKNKEHEHMHEEFHTSKVVSLNKNIFLFGEINPDSSCEFLKALNEADSTPGLITLNICSGGGWVEGAMLMYDAIKSTKNPVKTVACGAVYSSALLPFVAGDLRLAHPSATFLFHPMSMGMGEVTLGAARAVVGETARLFRMYCDYIAAISKLTAEGVALLMQRESYMTADDAQKKGIVHKLIPYTGKKFQLGLPKKKVVTPDKKVAPEKKKK